MNLVSVYAFLPDYVEFIFAYIPNTEDYTFAQALSLAKERDMEAARCLKEDFENA